MYGNHRGYECCERSPTECFVSESNLVADKKLTMLHALEYDEQFFPIVLLVSWPNFQQSHFYRPTRILRKVKSVTDNGGEQIAIQFKWNATKAKSRN